MKNFIKLFVTRYVATISIFGSLVLFGIVSYVGLGIDLFPEIEVPIVAVSTTYPGAGSEEIVRQISEPIEGTLSTVPGISNVTSTSSEGFSLVIEFNSGVDIDQAAIDVSQRVNSVVGQLPDDATAPTVSKFDPADQPILNIAVTAPGVALGDIQTYVEDNIQPALQRVEGVADVTVVGPADREIQVLLDPAELASYDLSADQVSGAIGGSTVDLPIGDISFSGSRILLTGRNTPQTLSAVGNILVDSALGLTVNDVATVRDASAEATTYARVNGEPVVLLEVQKVSGGNSVAVGNNVDSAVETLSLPEGYTAQIVTDTTTETESTVNDTLSEIFIAIAAVALVVMFFVGRLGTVFAVVLAIPISIAGAFILFGLAGFTLNLITLLSITVAVGLVVDDSIVVAENIDRFQVMGYDRKEAVIRGASEVAAAVLAATLSLLAVFLPISFLPGIIGDFFQQFGLSMAAMITFSYLASMFFLTMTLAYMPNPLPPGWKDLPKALGKVGSDARWTLSRFRKVWFYVLLVAAAAGLYYLATNVLSLSPVVAVGALLLPIVFFVVRYLGRLVLYVLGAIFLTLYKAGDRATNFVRDAYGKSLHAVLGHAWIALAAAVVLFGTLFFVFPRIGFVFTPPSDTGQLIITMELPTGTSLDQTNFLTGKLEDSLYASPLVDTVQTTVGSSDDLGTSSPSRASITAELVDDREQSTDELSLVFQNRLEEVLAAYPEADLSIATETGGAPTSSGYTLNLASNDLELLRQREPDIRAVLADNANLRNVSSSLAASISERVFVLDNAALTGTGLTPSAIYQTLRTYETGSAAGKLRTGGNEYDIVVQANPVDIQDEQALISLPIYAPALQTEVPISQFGQFETRDAPSTINRANQAYSLDFEADLAPGANDLLSVRSGVEETLQNRGLIDDRVVLSSAGGLDLVGDLVVYGPIAFALALLLNYLVIGTQFNSFKFPVYLLLTVPLALIGALWLLYALNTSLDIIGVLGVVMLIGLVTKNAILLLEVLMERINEEGGKVESLREALVEAGRLRFRPIVMTTVTVAIISLPLLLGLGEGSELRYSLGLIILGGVVTSALLTFYVVPAAFYQFERKNFEKDREEGSGPQTTPPRTVERADRRPVVVAPKLPQGNPQTASSND